MTIHKAKGLEFDLVVLADASRSSPRRAEPVYLMEEIGIAAAMDQVEEVPIAYRLARALDADQSRAEEDRLLYVAATRARERLIGSGRKAPATAVGRMVHAAIHRRAMPHNAMHERFLENEAFRAGLVDPLQRQAAIRESSELLQRLAAHALWDEIGTAEELQREIPFTTSDPEGTVQSGQIDLLWRDEEGWKIVDFKTDTLRDDDDLEAAVKRHRKQVERYVRSAANILGEQPMGMLCFLDSREQVELVVV